MSNPGQQPTYTGLPQQAQQAPTGGYQTALMQQQQQQLQSQHQQQQQQQHAANPSLVPQAATAASTAPRPAGYNLPQMRPTGAPQPALNSQLMAQAINSNPGLAAQLQQQMQQVCCDTQAGEWHGSCLSCQCHPISDVSFHASFLVHLKHECPACPSTGGEGIYFRAKQERGDTLGIRV